MSVRKSWSVAVLLGAGLLSGCGGAASTEVVYEPGDEAAQEAQQREVDDAERTQLQLTQQNDPYSNGTAEQSSMAVEGRPAWEQ